MRLFSSILALALTAGAALAADTGPLTPGAPAGVKRAQMDDSTIVAVGLGALAVAVIVVAATGDDDTPVTPAPPATTTTTTGTV
jgi:hypothetical protein